MPPKQLLAAEVYLFAPAGVQIGSSCSSPSQPLYVGAHQQSLCQGTAHTVPAGHTRYTTPDVPLRSQLLHSHLSTVIQTLRRKSGDQVEHFVGPGVWARAAVINSTSASSKGAIPNACKTQWPGIAQGGAPDPASGYHHRVGGVTLYCHQIFTAAMRRCIWLRCSWVQFFDS